MPFLELLNRSINLVDEVRYLSAVNNLKATLADIYGLTESETQRIAHEINKMVDEMRKGR